MKKLVLFFFLVLIGFINEVLAQNVEMAEGLRSSGKIYVVVAVLCIIFIGIVAYLFNLDTKLAKLKKEVDQLKK